MAQNSKRYPAIYARKSKFTHKGDSIEVQIEKCKNYASVRSLFESEDELRIYRDEGYSGGNMDRPEFQKLITDCMAGRISAIVCYKMDRISRNLNDFCQLYEKLKSHSVQFISVNDNFDTSTPTGEAMLKITMVFAELERNTIAERIRDNMLSLAKTGRWLGGTTPLGYRSVQLEQPVAYDNKIRYLHKLETVPEEKSLYLQLFHKYHETGSLTGTEDYCYQIGLRSRNGHPFSTIAIRDILRNPVYAAADMDTYRYFLSKGSIIGAEPSHFNGRHGLAVYNKTKQTGKNHSLKPMDEWIVSVGKHEAFISGKEWLELQEMLDKSRSRAFRRPRSHTALLSGLLRCAHCHSEMRVKTYNRVTDDGQKVYAYLCLEKERSHMQNCNMKNPNGIELDRFVCEEIKKLPEKDSSFHNQIETIRQELSDNACISRSEIAALTSNIAVKERQIENLIQNLSSNTSSVANEYMQKEIEKLHMEKLKMEQKIQELQLIEQDKSKILDEIELLQDHLSDFASTFDNMTYEEKRKILRTLIKCIVWDGENVHIYLAGSHEGDEFLEPIERGSK